MSDRSTSLVLLAGTALSVAVALLVIPHPVSADAIVQAPAPTLDETAATGATSETVVLAGGCFWGVQGVFQHVDGVTSAVSGYSGGTRADASYQTVSSGTTGHAESVKITFDPHTVSFGKILRIYFSVVTDPTKLDAQGPDEGPQYRSEIFTSTPEQKHIAEHYLAQLAAAHVYPAPIVTKVSTLSGFYPAEAYHQNYLTEHPRNRYIAVNDMPKVEGLQALFPDQYRQSPVLTTDASN